jgi:hypothetical protein
MTTKSKHFLRSLLLIPYFAWGIALLFVLLVNRLSNSPDTLNTFFNALVGVVSFYAIGIVIWGVPYTLLAIGLILWSINKPEPNIYKMFYFSPLLLSILMVIEIALISFWPPQARSFEDLTNFISPTLLAVIPSLVFGYSFVGVGIIIYKAVRHLNFLKTEEETK